jgi:hypothetical protein
MNYRDELISTISEIAEKDKAYAEEAFFFTVTESLSDAGIIDNVEYSSFKNSARGMKVDGFSWNELERSFSVIYIDYDIDDDVPVLGSSGVNKLANSALKVLSNLNEKKFLSTLEESTDLPVIESYRFYAEKAIKFKVIVLSTKTASSRLKKIREQSIHGKPVYVELWDAERIFNIINSEAETEPFEVDFQQFSEKVFVLPASSTKAGSKSYLCALPGTILSELYDEFGQRLLEANVRSFLDFRSGVNKGIRKTLVEQPENFFAFNNGLTCTATDIELENTASGLMIRRVNDLQIVNGGQTTASIYFAPREKGGIGDFLYKNIDLTKVFVQMKLTVLEDFEEQDSLKSTISESANTQNSIQKSDLVSNHPFHLNLEKLSRKVPMPANESGFSSKWFYERSRGQYGIKLRALSGRAKSKFELEYPKKQKFGKTDMAKFENTWRLKPYEVKRGAQANLKLLSQRIVEEFEDSPLNFGQAFYKDLIAKAILFTDIDSAIGTSEWYKAERGLKAETVTYTIALMRYLLLQQNLDINLDRIFKNQRLSPSMTLQAVSLGKLVREKIFDIEFRYGVANPSEFCKSERAWNRFKEVNDYDLTTLEPEDYLDQAQQKKLKAESDELSEAEELLSKQTNILEVTSKEWQMIKEFFIKKGYPIDHKNVGLPTLCANISVGGKLPTDKQSNEALKIRSLAYEMGFDHIV